MNQAYSTVNSPPYMFVSIDDTGAILYASPPERAKETFSQRSASQSWSRPSPLTWKTNTVIMIQMAGQGTQWIISACCDGTSGTEVDGDSTQWSKKTYQNVRSSQS